jgi:hypothetical protein
MNKHLCNEWVLDVNVLNFFWGDVFTLRQLEDVLLSVDDSQGPILQDKWNTYDHGHVVLFLKPTNKTR